MMAHAQRVSLWYLAIAPERRLVRGKLYDLLKCAFDVHRLAARRSVAGRRADDDPAAERQPTIWLPLVVR
jgi:hypothetical protein